MPPNVQDALARRVAANGDRFQKVKEDDHYFYNQPVEELIGGARVRVNGREMSMFASYSYLGLINHPRINAAAHHALDNYGTGTHGVRTLAGTLPIHRELENTIALFKQAEDAVTFSSGYVTNLSVISALVSRGDVVFSDKLNHASILDGCLMSNASLVRFPHNDMAALEQRLQEAPTEAARLVVVDGVFSMDGDITDLPALTHLCKKYNAWLMVDEAHSVGVLGKTGRGVEEHFNLPGVVDIKMGTLSKTIPSIGGYVAGSKELISYIRHTSRGYIFSAALPPAQAAAANEAFKVIDDEPWRLQILKENEDQFRLGLINAGFDTMNSETAILPILCQADETAFEMTRLCQRSDVFILPVVSPAVPQNLARLRATVTAAHKPEDISYAVEIIAAAGRKVGLIA
jgi:glycine C-acetyltransferase